MIQVGKHFLKIFSEESSFAEIENWKWDYLLLDLKFD